MNPPSPLPAAARDDARRLADFDHAGHLRAAGLLLQREPALRSDALALLARHYSPERLDREAARQHFVPPDRLPLPPCPAPEPT